MRKQRPQRCAFCEFYSKQFDRARATLDSALRSAPDNPQIKESRALVDQLAGQAAK